MGFNTTVVVLNDALGSIEKDSKFGEKLANAILSFSARDRRLNHYIPSGCDCNAAEIIETHHADYTVAVAVGGNCASVLCSTFGFNHTDESVQVRLLEELADKLGYRISKRRK